MRMILILLVVLGAALPAGHAGEATGPPSPELLKQEYLFEVVRHLYRWYLDETDAEKVVGQKEVAFWIRDRMPKLDKGDESRFGEIVIPALNVKVVVKKADYAVAELDLVVKQDTFKIVNVTRGDLPADATGFHVVTVSYQAMRDYGHRTRTQVRFPDDALLRRMRHSARQSILDYLVGREKAGRPTRAGTIESLKAKENILHLAPISDVANETWLFWETGRMLIHYASDIDIADPAMWEHDKLAVKLYDIDEQTVVSLDEVAGSNAYMTRDHVGRILFNCIVLGRRVILPPSDKAATATGGTH
jgi:hypothetical protein